MKELIVNILLGLSVLVWLSCIVVHLSIQLHYSVHKEGFFGRFLLQQFTLKSNYFSIPKEMTPKDRTLFLFSFMGIFIFFLPGGYFLGSLLHRYLINI